MHPTFAMLSLAAAASAAFVTRATTYVTSDDVSSCQQGINLFCTGNTGGTARICGNGKTDTFDAKATKDNEDACKGLKREDRCIQTIACV